MPVRRARAFFFATIPCLMLGFASGLALPAAAQRPGADSVPRPAADIWRPGYMWGEMITSPAVRARMQRRWVYTYSGVPPEYRGKVSPLPATAETLDRGRRVYEEHCAACHRIDGMGGGDAALRLSPPPALLSRTVPRADAVDEYLLWAISDGGRWFDTAMPGFQNVLTRDEIWAIVGFMRAGFPKAASGNGPRP